MRAARHHDEHARLVRKHVRALENREINLESRSPQRGRDRDDSRGRGSGRGGNGRSSSWQEWWRQRFGNNNGNGNGNNNGGGNTGGGNTTPRPTTARATPTPAPPASTPRGGTNNSGGNGGSNGGGGSNGSNGGSGNGTSSKRKAPQSTSSSRSLSASSVAPSASATGIDTGIPGTPVAPARDPTGSDTGLGAGTSDAPIIPDIGQTSAAKQGLSAGVIAAVVILSVLVIVFLIVLYLRRRWVNHRHDRLRGWWSGRKRTSRSYADQDGGYVNEKSTADFYFTATQTQPSNFGPAVDTRSATPLDLTNIVPTAPPTAEVRRLRNGSDAHIVDPANSARFSIGSVGSNGTFDSFVVVMPATSSVAHRNSGTESFKFPKPPSVGTEVTSIHSRFGSNGSSANSYAAVCSTPTGVPAVAAKGPSSLSRPPLTPVSPARSAGSSDLGIPNPFADADGSESIHNPFMDHDSYASNPTAALGHFSPIETVRRGFLPTLRDELAVTPNDQVRIHAIYDDGWALADIVGSSPVRKGLIPLACLRDASETDLSALLNTKRVQSFYVSSDMY